MLAFIIPVAGSTLALLLIAAAVSASARLGRHLRTRGRPKHRDEALWLTPLLCACGAVCALTGLGVVALIPGVPLAVLLAGTCAWLLLRDVGFGPRAWLPAARILLSHVRGAARYVYEDARALLGKLRGTGDAPGVPAAAGPSAAEPSGQGAAPARAVPSVRDDPVLGDAPAPAAVAESLAASGVPVPPAWAALCDTVAGFEPDSDEDLMAHVAGEAAGILTYSEAVRARADTLLHGTGLDPAYVAGHLELADEISDLASAVALVDRRFAAIYGALRDWVAGGGILPHNARQWFGDGAVSPHRETGTGGDIAA